MKIKFNSLCLSYYLAFRYLPKNNLSWIDKKNIKPNLHKYNNITTIGIKNSDDITKNLKNIIQKYKNKKNGILLSSGIDSIILAYFLPKNTTAYTIKFIAPNAIDESIHASIIAKHLGLKHKIVEVSWKDYQSKLNKLMIHKKAPLHPAEIGIYCGAAKARKDGVDNLFVGCGADALFGGLDKLLSKDWEYKEFVNRFNSINPKIILKNPSSVNSIYQKYNKNNLIDVTKFIKDILNPQTEQMFTNAITTAGCKIVAPYEKFYLTKPLDIKKIRKGESKYLLKEVYNKLYPDIKSLEKIPFARPMDQWMKNWNDIHRPEFRDDINIEELTGEQKWLIYCLQKFMDLIDKKYD